jgi:hypothetical protein
VSNEKLFAYSFVAAVAPCMSRRCIGLSRAELRFGKRRSDEARPKLP